MSMRVITEEYVAFVLHSERSVREDGKPIPSSSPGVARVASTGIPSEGNAPIIQQVPGRPCSQPGTANAPTEVSLQQDMVDRPLQVEETDSIIKSKEGVGKPDFSLHLGLGSRQEVKERNPSYG